MKVLVDTNVLLDVLGKREPFYAAAAEPWSLAERREIRAFISSVSFNNIYYLNLAPTIGARFTFRNAGASICEKT